MPVLAMLLPKLPPHKTQGAEMIVLEGWKCTLFLWRLCCLWSINSRVFAAGGDGRSKRDSRILLFSGCVYFMARRNTFSFYVWSKLGYQVSVHSVNYAVSTAMEIKEMILSN